MKTEAEIRADLKTSKRFASELMREIKHYVGDGTPPSITTLFYLEKAHEYQRALEGVLEESD